MSSYDNFVGKLASNLEKNNMQNHMRDFGNMQTDEHQKILDSFDRYDYDTFVDLVFNTVFDKYNHFVDGKRLKKHYEENSELLTSILSRTNEECLEDPNFSRALKNGTEYSRNLGNIMSYVLYYPEVRTGIGSVTREVSMDLLYLPSMKEDSPNAIRFDVKEQMTNDEYPYINYSVDILDTGEIIYNPAYQVEKERRIQLPNNPSHLKVSDGINIVRDIFIYLFEKSGIKEPTTHK